MKTLEKNQCMFSFTKVVRKEQENMCQGNHIMLQILISLVHNNHQMFSGKNNKTAAERSLCVCRRAENVASQDQREFGLLHKQETKSWRPRWLLPSSDAISPGGLNTPDLMACLTIAHTPKHKKHAVKYGVVQCSTNRQHLGERVQGLANPF